MGDGDAALSVVAVGSNIDPEANILRGLRLLSMRLAVTVVSTWYVSGAVGEDGRPRPDPDFVNGAVAVETSLRRHDLVGVLRQVEAACGRRRTADRFAPRTLDLDLVVLRGRPVEADWMDRAHVAVPVAEVAQDLVAGTGRLDAHLAGMEKDPLRRLPPGPLAAWRPPPKGRAAGGQR